MSASAGRVVVRRFCSAIFAGVNSDASGNPGSLLDMFDDLRNSVVNGYAGAQANVRDAKLAVRNARTRKPVAYIELTPAAKTRFWASGACS